MQYGDRELRELWPQLRRRIPSFFAGLEIEPALLHGDLWSGNAAENEEGPGESNFHELRTYTVRCKLSAFAHNKGTNFSFDYKFNLTKLKNNFFFLSFSVIFDPASFYGHHEFDLAIAGMFGGFTSKFYDAYHQLIPKAPGFATRHKLYVLFHYINHW